ncbi:MAG: carboxypeptidase regulatory-like domain-containing protein [Candidatus Baltobacteraceae bacterium]
MQLFVKPARAQSLTPSDIAITVRDAATSAPIDNAEVFLLGNGNSQSSLTDADGKLLFANVQPGIYRIAVQHAGYLRSEIAEFEVGQSSRVTIVAKLVSTLKEIATVTAHGSVSINQESLGADSAERKVSQSLKDALGRLAGVSIDDSNYENAAFNISLRNHDSSQTGTSIDGMSVSGPAAQALGAAQDLFTGATVNFSPTAGYLGGNVNFQTLQPTKTRTFNALGTIGNLGAASDSISATGSIGRLSLAAQMAMNASDFPLTGATYRDQSGRTYEHTGGHKTQAALIKFSYSLSKRASVNLGAMLANGEYDQLCQSYVTLAACGYGSLPRNFNHNVFLTLGVSTLIGNVQSTVFAGLPFGSFGNEDTGRVLSGTQLPPYFLKGSYNTLYFGAYGSITARRHTDSFGFSSANSHQGTIQTYNGAARSFAGPRATSRNLWFRDKIKANEKIAMTHGVSVASATGAGSSLILSETADWTPAKNDAFEASVSLGSAQANYQTSTALTDAPDADYDCFNRSVFVEGPNDSAVPQTSVSYDLSWRHKFRAGNWNLALYRQNASGQSLRASVPIASEPASLFPNGLSAYLQGLQEFWTSPTVCGALPFNPARVYVTQNLSGLGQVNQGFSFSGQLRIGKNLSLFPTYTIGSTYLSSVDPRLQYPGGFYSAGMQLPKKPLRTAGLILDGVLPKSALEWLVGAQSNDVNNPNNLPAYTVFNAGVVLSPHFGGTLTLVESNIFGIHTGLFTTYQDINPRPVVGGGAFAYSTTPVAPRQWTVTWRIPWREKLPVGRPPASR